MGKLSMTEDEVGQAKATRGLPTGLEVELTMILLYGLLLDNIYLFK